MANGVRILLFCFQLLRLYDFIFLFHISEIRWHYFFLSYESNLHNMGWNMRHKSIIYTTAVTAIQPENQILHGRQTNEPKTKKKKK